MQVDEDGGELPSQIKSALRRQPPLGGKNGPQGRTVYELHHDVHAARLAPRIDPHHTGVIQPLSHFLLAPKALEKDDVALEVQVGDLGRDGVSPPPPAHGSASDWFSPAAW